MQSRKPISKRTGSKKTSSVSQSKPFKLIATAKMTYGPFPTKAAAQQVLAQVSQVPRAKTSSILKTSRGYSFSASMQYGLKSVSQKNLAISTIKKHAPSASVSFKKA